MLAGASLLLWFGLAPGAARAEAGAPAPNAGKATKRSAKGQASGAGSKDTGATSPKKTSQGERPWIRRHAPVRNMLEVGVYGGLLFVADDHDFYDPATAPQKPLWRTGAGDWGARLAFFPLSWLGLEVEGNVAPTFTRTITNRFALLYGFRGHAIARLPGYRIVPFVLGGFGLMGVRSSSKAVGRDVDPMAHWGLGVELFATELVALRLEGRHLMGAQAARQNDVTSHFEVLFGVSFTPRLKARKPPKPPKPSDRDGDGFIDTRDACIDEPGVAPDGCPRRDRDGDGVYDRDDKCVDTPGEKPDGCPPPDTDGDGILDRDDACVDEPETRNGYQDEDGCPDELPKQVKAFTGVIEGIEFDFNQATIRPESRPVLDKAVQVLQEYPDIRLEIVGHTDNVGTREFNLDLSRRRAQAVRDYLVAGGVAADRLEVRGAGPDEPIAGNDTEAGRARNRRTEFHVLTRGAEAPSDGSPPGKTPRPGSGDEKPADAGSSGKKP